MREMILDHSLLEEDPHGYLAALFGWPEHYGRNLDALHDMLGEICESTEIYMPRGQELGSQGRRILRVLRDSAEENPNLKVFYFE